MKKKKVEKLSIKLIQILLIITILMTNFFSIFAPCVYADNDTENNNYYKLNTSTAKESYLAYTGDKDDKMWQGVCIADDYIVVCGIWKDKSTVEQDVGNIYVFDKSGNMKDCVEVPKTTEGGVTVGHHCNSVTFDSKNNTIIIAAFTKAPIAYDINLETGKLTKKNLETSSFAVKTNGKTYNPTAIGYDAASDRFVLMYSYLSKYYLYTSDEFYNNKASDKSYKCEKYNENYNCQQICVKNSKIYSLVSDESIGKTVNYIYVYDLNDDGKMVATIVDDESNLEMEAVTFDTNGTMYVAWHVHNGTDASNGDKYKKYALYRAFTTDYHSGKTDVETQFLSSIDMIIEMLENDDEIPEYANIMKYIYWKYTGNEKYKTNIDDILNSLSTDGIDISDVVTDEDDYKVNDKSIFITDRKTLIKAFKAYSTNTELVNHVDDFLDMQKKYGVNAVFAASVAIVETTAGTNGDATNGLNNWFGMGPHKQYASVKDNIDAFGYNIAKGDYYFKNKKYTVRKIGPTYCTSDPKGWCKDVVKFMNDMYSAVGMNASISGSGDIIKTCKEVSKEYLRRNGYYSQSNLVYNNIKAQYKKKYLCCATYVAIVLWKSGALTEKQINKYNYNYTGSGGFPNMLKAAGWKNLGKFSTSKAKPGDVLLNSPKHVMIYAGPGTYVYDETTAVTNAYRTPTGNKFDHNWDLENYDVWRKPKK